MATVALDELVLHGWDLARATGQAYEPDPASAQAVFEFTSAMSTPEHLDSREGLFGPVVEVAPDAPLFDRALGFAGRDPGWTPPDPHFGAILLIRASEISSMAPKCGQSTRCRSSGPARRTSRSVPSPVSSVRTAPSGAQPARA